MTFREMVEKRYSVKKFKEQKVEEEKLKRVLETASLAPTAKNAQSARIYVLKSDNAMKEARELTPCIYGAPICLMFAYDKEEAYTYPGNSGRKSGEEDCAITATHVMFAALEEGLGTCWVNRFDPDEAKKVFQLPENQEVVLLMPIGYAAEDFKPLANHTMKKPIDGIVKVL